MINFFGRIDYTSKIFISIILLVFYVVLRYRDRKNNIQSKKSELDFKNSGTSSNNIQNNTSPNESNDHIRAHAYSVDNRKDLSKDSKCGCFYCLKIFDPKEITNWCDHVSQEDTAICPYCGIDSIIGESSGFPITKEFLEKMHNYWF